MCNLYSLTKGQAAIRDWFRASNDRTGAHSTEAERPFHGKLSSHSARS